MRRNVRKRINQEDDLNTKIIKYSCIGISVLAIIVFTLLMYSKSLNDEVKDGTLTSEQISSILNNAGNIENTESASSEIGKRVDEVQNDLNSINENNTTSNNVNKDNTINNTNSEVLNTSKVTSVKTENKVDEKEIEDNSKPDVKVELSFTMPVEGETIRDFAVENLIYSDTLQEWTTHTGIDIKADKTTVVKAAEAGTVKTIKNDPRYGLTVIIQHENGFQTVYSNLLTSEFVVEGEKVEKGQSLGTVGNTAAFEIADEPHLHFEILRDSVQVDPNIYLK